MLTIEVPIIRRCDCRFTLRARLMRSASTIATGYDAPSLDAWTVRARTWASGKKPDDLPYVQPPGSAGAPRDVFIFHHCRPRAKSGGSDRTTIQTRMTTMGIQYQRAGAAVSNAKIGMTVLQT